MSSKDNSSRWTGAWLRDSGVMLLSQGALTATATLVTVLLTRSLSKYQFGLFASFLGLAQALSFVIDSGLSTWLLRECSQIRASDIPTDQQDRNIAQLLRPALSTIAYLGVAAIIGSIMIGSALGLSLQLALAQGAFMGYIALLAGATALESRLRAERRLRQVLGAVLCEKTSLLVLVLVVLASGGGVLGVGIAHLIAGFLRLSLDYGRSRKLLNSAPTQAKSSTMFPRPSTIFPLLRVTAPFGLNSAALSFLPRMDTALVATVSVVGASYYGLGFQIVTTAAVVPAIASITLLPLLTANRGAHELRWKIFGVMSGIGVVAAGVGVLLAPLIVPLFFGHAYRPAVGAIQIMMLAIPSIFACNAIMPFLYTQGHERDVLRWILLPSALGTCLVLLGEVVVGPKGASLGLVARYLLVTISFVLLSHRRNSRLVPAISS